MIPRIIAHMIVKNEERDLPRCLRSIASVVQGVVIADTGSTDRTQEVAEAVCLELKLPLHFRRYIGASELDANRELMLWDFAKARNAALQWAARMQPEWLLWMDADDELLTPEVFQTLPFQDYDVFGCSIQVTTEHKQIHHRLWRVGTGIHFEGPVHEYPTISGWKTKDVPELVIRHDNTAVTGHEHGLKRNARILQRAWDQGKHESRTAFYLAQSYHHLGEYAKAVEWYNQRIGMGQHYLDEYLFAMLYKARCQRLIQDAHGAEYTLLTAVSKHKDWGEFWWELADLAREQGRTEEALGYALQAKNKTPLPTSLWREYNKYGAAMDAMVADLTKRAKISLPVVQQRIAIYRPGGIGDVLMSLNLIPALKDKYPGYAVDYYCDQRIADGLRQVIQAAGVQHVQRHQNFDALQGIYEHVFKLVGHLQSGFPYVPLERHVIQQFALEMGLHLDGIPALTLGRPELIVPFKYATVQTRAGWSKYKEWPQDRWNKLAELLTASGEINLVRIDEEPNRPLTEVITLFANAQMHIGIDSFANHLTNYYWTDQFGGRRVPGVILWGSTQPTGMGYADNTNLWQGLPCQPCFRDNPELPGGRGEPCINPPRATYQDDTPWLCMQSIRVEQVADAVRAMWVKTTPPMKTAPEGAVG